jgi:dTDP-4-amino-4,6-dideoxygalactose transaminase
MSDDNYIPVAAPTLGKGELQQVEEALGSGWITSGPKTDEFESAISDEVRAPAALGLSSCTAALHLALHTMGIESGDEVVTPPFTFTATANVVEHLGAKPVFADVRPDTMNLDPACVREAVTEDTKAILPVHYAGHPVALDTIQTIANENGIQIVEDAAHALGASHHGTPIGGSGNLCCFSFYATKNLTTAEGGMLTGPEELVSEARTASLHGMSDDAWDRYEEGGDWAYDVLEPGYKYNMTDIAAAIGLAQLERFDHFQARRKEIWESYNRAFGRISQLETPVIKDHVEHGYHLYPLRLNLDELAIDRDSFIEELSDRDIGTSVHFIPIHLFTYYREEYGYEPDDFPVAYQEFQRILSLPFYPGLDGEQIERVVEAVIDVVDQHKTV